MDNRIMICRCSSPAVHAQRAANQDARRYASEEKENKKKVAELESEIQSMTVKADQYDIMEVERVGDHLVVKAKYPSCTRCSFEGVKVMVFLNVSEHDVVLWKRIDPHFRVPRDAELQGRNAPSPAARFPASAEGWRDAVSYAKSKAKGPGPHRQGEW